ncbi:zinc finger, CCHC-type containing protein [Tanacetum coccineum]
MTDVAMKHMASNFAKLDKFERVDFKRWQKKMHFLLSNMSVVYVITTHIPEDEENTTMEHIRKRNKWENDDYVCREAKYMVEDVSSKKFLVSNFTNYKITDSTPVMEQYNELLDFKHTLKHKKGELTLVELGTHLRIEESLRVQDSDKPKGNNVVGPSVVNMVKHNNSTRYTDNRGKRKHQATKADPNKKSKLTCWKRGKPRHLKKDCKGGKVGNKANGSDDDVAGWVDSGATVHMLNIINDIGNLSFIKLNDSIIWHARLGHVYFKRMQDMSKDGLIPAFDMDTKKSDPQDLCVLHDTPSLGNKKYFVTFIDDASRFCYVYLLHSKDEALDKFKVFKIEVELQQRSPIKRFRTDRGGPSQGFWDEAMLTSCFLLNKIPNKRNMITPYELWTKRKPNLDSLKVLGCRAVLRLLDPKLKTLGERVIERIFVGYVDHSKAFRFYVIEPNESVLINSIIESKDAIFDENRFLLVPRPSQMSLINGAEDIGGSMVLEEVTDKDDPKTFDEAMESEDVAFWKEAIIDEMDSIMGNNTWVFADLPPGCKPLGCKWIFKRKMKVDRSVQKFKARLVIQGFRQNSGIDYFDTYAPMARISTIRLLIALTSIHNLIIHQMDVKTTFLNGELDEEIYMNQHQGFIMPDNENKDIGEDNVILGIRIRHESNGIAISQSHYIEKLLKKFNYFDCTLVLDVCHDLNKLADIAFVEGLTYIGYPSVLEGCTDASWISNTKDNSSTSDWVFLLGRGAIS